MSILDAIFGPESCPPAEVKVDSVNPLTLIVRGVRIKSRFDKAVDFIGAIGFVEHGHESGMPMSRLFSMIAANSANGVYHVHMQNPQAEANGKVWGASHVIELCEEWFKSFIIHRENGEVVCSGNVAKSAAIAEALKKATAGNFIIIDESADWPTADADDVLGMIRSKIKADVERAGGPDWRDTRGAGV